MKGGIVMIEEKTEYVIKKQNKDIFLGEPNMVEDYPKVSQLNFANKFVDKTIATMFLCQQKQLINEGFDVFPIKVIYEY